MTDSVFFKTNVGEVEKVGSAFQGSLDRVAAVRYRRSALQQDVAWTA